MIESSSILAIITARGGSKGLPGKNIRPLAGLPLIVHSIKAAQNSQYIDRLIVSTDSEEIIRVAGAYGAEPPFRRPDSLASDLARQEDAILHAMDWAEVNVKKFDYVMLLPPTNPLRDARETDLVIESFHANPAAKSMMTLMKCEHLPVHMNTLPADGCLKDFIDPTLKFKNRQELPEYFQISGSVCIAEWDFFRKEQSFMTDETYSFITSQRNGLDIDTIRDFKLAELYLTDPELA